MGQFCEMETPYVSQYITPGPGDIDQSGHSTEVFWGYADGPKQLHESGGSTNQEQACQEMEREGWRWK